MLPATKTESTNKLRRWASAPRFLQAPIGGHDAGHRHAGRAVPVLLLLMLQQPTCASLPALGLALLPPHGKAGDGEGHGKHRLHAHVPLEHEVGNLQDTVGQVTGVRVQLRIDMFAWTRHMHMHPCIAASIHAMHLPCVAPCSEDRARSPACEARANAVSACKQTWRRQPHTSMPCWTHACRMLQDPHIVVAGAQAVVPVAWRAEKGGATDAINTGIAAPGMHGLQQIAACCVPRVMCSCEYGLMCPPPLAEDDVEKPLVRRGTCWARRRREDEELIFAGLSTSCAALLQQTRALCTFRDPTPSSLPVCSVIKGQMHAMHKAMLRMQLWKELKRLERCM